MPITKKESIKLKKLIRDYVNARVDLSWMGGAQPDDAEEIEKDAAKALIDMQKFIKIITES